MKRVLIAAVALFSGATAWAGSIDTSFIEAPWPRQRVHETEVGRYAVRWRERASKQEGIFASVRFAAPLGQPAVWDLANQYQDVGKITPGVTAVRYLERSETHEKIEVDVKVLWKALTLAFDVEKGPPRVVRFRLVNKALGEYRGLCLFESSTGSEGQAGPSTSVELATWLKPSRPVPMRLLLLVERIALLQGARHFLEECDKHVARSKLQASVSN